MGCGFLRTRWGQYARPLAAHGLCQLHHHMTVLGALALHPKDLLVALKLADAPTA